MSALRGETLFISGGSRGIGRAMNGSRRPEIMADAAHAIFCRPARETTGNFFVDEEVLAADGVTDFEPYSFVAGAQLIPDLYVEA